LAQIIRAVELEQQINFLWRRDTRRFLFFGEHFLITAAICDEAVALLSKIKGKFENKKEIGCHSLVRAVGEGRERKWACYTLATRPIRGEAFNGAEIQCTP
jgi:hypothetical protein